MRDDYLLLRRFSPLDSKISPNADKIMYYADDNGDLVKRNPDGTEVLVSSSSAPIFRFQEESETLGEDINPFPVIASSYLTFEAAPNSKYIIDLMIYSIAVSDSFTIKLDYPESSSVDYSPFEGPLVRTAEGLNILSANVAKFAQTTPVIINDNSEVYVNQRFLLNTNLGGTFTLYFGGGEEGITNEVTLGKGSYLVATKVA